MNNIKLKALRVIVLPLCVLAQCALERSGHAQDRPDNAAPRNATAPASPASAGLLPIPNYSADFWTRGELTGDWFGVRTYLANKGLQVGLEWNHYVQGVADGGRDRTTAYGGTVDYTLNIDLMRMGVLPGALIRFRAESRYGSSVNGAAGPIPPPSTPTLCFRSLPNLTRTSPSRLLTSTTPSFFRSTWASSSARSIRWMATRTSSLLGAERASS